MFNNNLGNLGTPSFYIWMFHNGWRNDYDMGRDKSRIMETFIQKSK